MKTFISIMAAVLLTAVSAAGEEPFGPWNTDVAVGDSAVPWPLHRCTPGCHDRTGGAERGVYDAFTGGAVLLIRVFQIWISPLDGPSCRFSPTCSAYGKIAVQKHGAFLGGILAGDRILRCNVFSKPGHDPVPDRLSGK